MCRGTRQVMVADVVTPSLEQRDGDRNLQRIAHKWQVALEQLILKRLGPRGDQYLAAGEQRGNKIGESLARARPRLRNELPARFDGMRDRLGHRELLRSEAIRGKAPGKQAFRPEDYVQIGSAQRVPGSTGSLTGRPRRTRARCRAATRRTSRMTPRRDFTRATMK